MLLFATIIPASSAPDRKIFKKAAEKVWSARNDLFDASKEVPDSIRNGASAVILADYFYVNADNEYYENAMSITNRTKRQYWVRRMIKLYDSKAVEEFSEHEFGARQRFDVAFFTLSESDNAFGARVHKPDGTVVDVDINEAFDITEGKKGSKKDAVGHKIAIPGLEPGDVLEYFDYTEEWINDLDLPDLNIVPYDEYPVMRFVLEGEFSPRLTVEYRTFNGAFEPAKSLNDKGKNSLALELYNIGILTDKRFIRKYRQLPFLRLSTLNNTSRFRFYPSTMRGGGLYGNIPSGTIYRDIKSAFAVSDYNLPFPGQVKKIVGNFRKNNPDAGAHEVLDATWLAAVYANRTGKKNGHSDYWVALMMADLINKMKLAPGDVSVGFINPRTDVSTKEIMRWSQPDFGVLVGDSIYLMNGRNYLPGELPGDYQGEEGGAFSADRSQLTMGTLPTVFKAYVTRGSQNRATTTADISFDPAERSASMKGNIKLTGTKKSMGSDFTTFGEWAAAVEDYLGIPENKRYKETGVDDVERRKEIEEAGQELMESLVCKDISVENVAVDNHGVVPGKPAKSFSASAKVESCVSDAGNDLLLNVGRFVGNNMRIEGDERNRQFDVYMNSPHQNYYDLRFDVPEGYEVDPATLESLGVNVSNKYGSYFASVRLDDAGKILVNVRERYNFYFMPQADWQMLLDLYDAAAAFNDTMVLAKKK